MGEGGISSCFRLSFCIALFAFSKGSVTIYLIERGRFSSMSDLHFTMSDTKMTQYTSFMGARRPAYGRSFI